jgi:hypothetical protein
MFPRQQNRWFALPALVAAAVFVVWPSLVRGNCCCNHSLLSPCSIASCSTATCSTLEHPPACCQTTAACCQSHGTTENSAGDTVATVGGCNSSDECQCGIRCCRSLTAVTSGRGSDTKHDSKAVFVSDTALPCVPNALRLRLTPWRDDSLHVLSAQEHCALICRWLK